MADGVRVSLTIKNFTGVLYVKGYSKDERCRSVVQTPESHESPVDFTVHFGDCGLVHVNVSIKSKSDIKIVIVIFVCFWVYNIWLTYVIFVGFGQLCTGDAETSKTGNLKRKGIPHQVHLPDWRTKRNSSLQRVDVDHSWNYRKHWTATDMFHAHCNAHWRRGQLRRDRRKPRAPS